MRGATSTMRGRTPAARSRRPRPRARAAVCAAWLAALAPSGAALAQAPPPEVTADVVPVVAAGGALPWGWSQILVRIQNSGSAPARGQVEVSSQRYSDRHVFTASAPYVVGAGASVSVRVPVHVAPFGDAQTRVLDEADRPLAARSLSSTAQCAAVLLDVSETSRLRGALNDAPISPLYMPTGRGLGASPAPVVWIGQPSFDGATGDPLLPDRAALYSGADAVVMRTDTLARLGGAELDALAGYVLAGGTLALAVARPEDLRHPTLVALVGGEVARGPLSAETLREMAAPRATAAPGSLGRTGRAIPEARSASAAVLELLSGWSGGNLRGSAYGSSASYGLGEVHLLAFDPTRRPAVDDPWAQIRTLDLARRAYDRRSTVVFRPGDDAMSLELNRVRQQLDPNESSRWAIGLSALLLCAYAVLAGPINFSLAARNGRPLRALRHLPVYAALTFALILGVGVLAKGFSGRARHLTLVEAGAGLSKGTARRYRGFFVSSSKDLTVRATDASSVVGTAVLPELSERRDRLIVDREGARLVDVAALPWQTVVVREDGFAALGEGVAVLDEPGGGVAVINRSGRDLRASVLWLPSGEARYFARIEDGERVSSTSAGVDLSTHSDGRSWLSLVGAGRRVGAMDIHDLGALHLLPIVEADAPGLGAAWQAVEEAAGDGVDWFPAGVPVLLGQLDGGEGRSSDSGLRLESDRVLVRIVGFGGRS
jgi:hypothetical protein